MCACVQIIVYITQHSTMLIIFPPNLQTIIIAQMLSIGGDGHTLVQNFYEMQLHQSVVWWCGTTLSQKLSQGLWRPYNAGHLYYLSTNHWHSLHYQ